MTRLGLILACAAMLLMGVPQARAATIGLDGQCAGAVAPVVLRIFQRYPHGGLSMATAIASFLKSNPLFVADVICASRQGNAAQRVAVAAGYAQAQGANVLFASGIGGPASTFVPPFTDVGFGGGSVASPN